MALPPILSNLPIVKLFGAGGTQPGKAAPTPAGRSEASLPQDMVELSEAARKRLEGAKIIIGDESKARCLASEARVMLSESDISLGLDPKFS